MATEKLDPAIEAAVRQKLEGIDLKLDTVRQQNATTALRADLVLVLAAVDKAAAKRKQKAGK